MSPADRTPADDGWPVPEGTALVWVLLDPIEDAEAGPLFAQLELARQWASGRSTPAAQYAVEPRLVFLRPERQTLYRTRRVEVGRGVRGQMYVVYDQTSTDSGGESLHPLAHVRPDWEVFNHSGTRAHIRAVLADGPGSADTLDARVDELMEQFWPGGLPDHDPDSPPVVIV